MAGTETQSSVLVIDNDKADVDAVIGALEPEGYSVFAAASGEMGAISAKKIRPDLILLNLSTPGTNGLEICTALRTVLPDVPIVLITEMEGTVDPSYRKIYGIVGSLKKPLESGSLLSELGSMLVPVEAPGESAAPEDPFASEDMDEAQGKSAVPEGFVEQADLPESAVAEEGPEIEPPGFAPPEESDFGAFKEEESPDDEAQQTAWEIPEGGGPDSDRTLRLESREPSGWDPTGFDSQPAAEGKASFSPAGGSFDYTNEASAGADKEEPLYGIDDEPEDKGSFKGPTPEEGGGREPARKEAGRRGKSMIKKLLLLPFIVLAALAAGAAIAYFYFFGPAPEVRVPFLPPKPAPQAVAPAAAPAVNVPAPFQAAPQPEAKRPEAAAKKKRSYYVQFGFFTSRKNAKRFADSLSEEGLKVFVQKSSACGKRGYRVLMGGFKSRRAAFSAAKRMKKTYGVPTAVHAG